LKTKRPKAEIITDRGVDSGRSSLSVEFNTSDETTDYGESCSELIRFLRMSKGKYLSGI
jgi:hypothetical protein